MSEKQFLVISTSPDPGQEQGSCEQLGQQHITRHKCLLEIDFIHLAAKTNAQMDLLTATGIMKANACKFSDDSQLFLR